MGHIVGYMEVSENCDRAGVLADIQFEAEREGDGYPGGVKWHDNVGPLGSRDEAEKWIRDHDNGWYDDHAVRFYSYYNAKTTKKMDDIRRRIGETSEKLAKYTKEHSVQKQKAEFIGCSECGSKLARNRLRGEICPVCGTDLRSKTTLETIKGYEDKIKSLWEKIEEEKKKQKNIRETLWLVKYEYHC